MDLSNGYERIAKQYIAARGNKTGGFGSAIVAEWARQFPSGAAVLDLGCGSGLPITQVLVERGDLQVYGLDASAEMVRAFQKNFPDVPVECSAIEESTFFGGRRFDGIVSWGVFFLLDAGTQRRAIAKVAAALKPGEGHFLFTSPEPVCEWEDAMTGLPSVSLGAGEYRRLYIY